MVSIGDIPLNFTYNFWAGAYDQLVNANMKGRPQISVKCLIQSLKEIADQHLVYYYDK